MRETAVVVGAVVGVSLLLVSLGPLSCLGVFSALNPDFSGTGRSVAGPPGPEGIAIDRETRIAYIFSNDGRAHEYAADILGQVYQLALSRFSRPEI